jgi:hypothetical protein
MVTNNEIAEFLCDYVTVCSLPASSLPEVAKRNTMILPQPLWLLSLLALCSTSVFASLATEQAKARIKKERAGSPDFDGRLESMKKVRASVSRFHLGNHLKKPTHRELREGIAVSERFEKNPHLIRRDDRALPPNATWEDAETPVIKPYADAFPPGEYPVNLTANIDAMPIGSGPGVLPGFPVSASKSQSTVAVDSKTPHLTYCIICL